MSIGKKENFFNSLLNSKNEIIPLFSITKFFAEARMGKSPQLKQYLTIRYFIYSKALKKEQNIYHVWNLKGFKTREGKVYQLKDIKEFEINFEVK